MVNTARGNLLHPSSRYQDLEERLLAGNHDVDLPLDQARSLTQRSST